MTHKNDGLGRTPPFIRLNYFYGQHLSHQDLRLEQSYLRGKLRFRNRCLHGWGVICGLLAEPADPAKWACLPEDGPDPEELVRKAEEILKKAAALEAVGGDGDAVSAAVGMLREQAREWARLAQEITRNRGGHAAEATQIRITPGSAIDADGNEIVVQHPVTVDIWAGLSAEERAAFASLRRRDIWVLLRYAEQPIHPVRPIVSADCAPAIKARYAHTRESFCVVVTTKRPDPDERCEPCCDTHAHEFARAGRPEIVLARIRGFSPGRPLAKPQIDNAVRRMLALRTPTRIVAASWVQGGAYDRLDFRRLLGLPSRSGPPVGLRLRFSRPVHVDTLYQGVASLWRVFRGDGLVGDVKHMELDWLERPTGDYAQEVAFRQASREDWSGGDRALFQLRSGFVMDRCCMPLSGYHVGAVPAFDPPVVAPPATAPTPGTPGAPADASSGTSTPAAPGTSAALSSGASSLASAPPPTTGATAPAADPDHPTPWGEPLKHPAPATESCPVPTTIPGPWRSGYHANGGHFESWFTHRGE